MDNRDFKGVWIPREIYLDKSLPWSAKIIFLEIHSFSGGTKECFMSNEYLGEFVGISPTQVSRHISLLKSRGLIELVSFDGVTRVLKSLLETCVKPQGGIDKNRKGVLIKTATPQ
jgi:DNA-binding transcriptional ArsR family regulator